MTLVEDDNVIQTFTADRTDETLGVGKGDEFKFQGGTTSNTEGEQGAERHHAHDGMAPTQKSLFFFADLEF